MEQEVLLFKIEQSISYHSNAREDDEMHGEALAALSYESKVLTTQRVRIRTFFLILSH